jgi:hypothetical protein
MNERTLRDAATAIVGRESQLSDFFWPPNLFALTSIILGDSGAYRLVVAPPSGRQWPPVSEWGAFVDAVNKRWVPRVTANPPGAPFAIRSILSFVLSFGETALRCVPSNWPLSYALLTLHAIADEACAGVGLIPADGAHFDFIQQANARLFETGSLATFPVSRVRVLPKMRTPQTGITLRSLSHHVATVQSEVRVDWQLAAAPAFGESEPMRVVLFPWPFTVEDHEFRETPGPLTNSPSTYGFFTYESQQTFDIDLFRRVLERARESGRVDAVFLPEGSVREHELPILYGALKQSEILLAGALGEWSNKACLRFFDPIDRAWTEGGPYDQSKHHRWQLEKFQIERYNLRQSLDPERRWWEAIDVPERCITFVSLSSWLTICHLICEDLARQEPVAELVRAVGPNLVIALLQDGPQMERRWPGKYAGVLADDPGSSVLTLTSLGMALRSRYGKDGRIAYPETPIVALWSDPDGRQEIRLDRNASAVVLTLANREVTEYSADGRSDLAAAGMLRLTGCDQITVT